MVAREGSAAVPGDPDRLAPLSRPESWLPAATLAASEAPDGELWVEHVPNRLVHADIEVAGAAGPVRFVAPVGTAVPVLSLVDHLCAWLELPAGAWNLHHADMLLPGFIILDDLSPAADGLLSLRLVKAEA